MSMPKYWLLVPVELSYAIKVIISDDDTHVIVIGKSRNLKRSSPKLAELQQKWDSIVKMN